MGSAVGGRLDELVRRDDDDEALGRRRDGLLARVRRAAPLHDPTRRRDLVGAVDRDVELRRAHPPRRTARPRGRARAPPLGRGDVATHRSDEPPPASAGRSRATVEPVPEPTRMPSSTSAAAASAATCFSRSLSTAEHLRSMSSRSPIALDGDVGRGVRRSELRIVRELPLQRQHRRDALTPVLLRGARIRTLSSTST